MSQVSDSPIESLSVGVTPTGKPLKADNFLQKVAEKEVREIGSVRMTNVIGFEDVGGPHARTGETPLEDELSPPAASKKMRTNQMSANQPQGTKFCQHAYMSLEADSSPRISR